MRMRTAGLTPCFTIFIHRLVSFTSTSIAFDFMYAASLVLLSPCFLPNPIYFLSSLNISHLFFLHSPWHEPYLLDEPSLSPLLFVTALVLSCAKYTH